MNVVSAYKPQVGLEEEVKKKLWDNLDELVCGMPQNENIFIRGNFNDHMQRSKDGYDGTHGGLGFGDENSEGVFLLEFFNY